MNANELADAMEIRASIRRKATSRKSVQENANDRLADQLDEAATMLRQQQEQIDKLTAIVALREMDIAALKKSCLDEIFNRTYADRSAEVMCDYWELAQAEVDGLKVRIERMIEKQSHYEAMAHAGGFEAGRQQAFFDRAREVARKIDNDEYITPED